MHKSQTNKPHETTFIMSISSIRHLDTSRLFPSFGWNKKKNEPFIRISMRGSQDQVSAYLGDADTVDEYGNNLYLLPLKEPGIHPKSIDQTKPSVFCRIPDRETANVIKFIDNMVQTFVETSDSKYANEFREAKFKPLLKSKEDMSDDDNGAVSVKLNTVNCNFVVQHLCDGGNADDPKDWHSSPTPGSVTDIVPGEVHSLLMAVAFSNIVIGSNTYGPKIWGNVVIIRKKPTSIITMGGVTIRNGVVVNAPSSSTSKKRQNDSDDMCCDDAAADVCEEEEEVVQRSKRAKTSRDSGVDDNRPAAGDEMVDVPEEPDRTDTWGGDAQDVSDEEEAPKPKKKNRRSKRDANE